MNGLAFSMGGGDFLSERGKGVLRGYGSRSRKVGGRDYSRKIAVHVTEKWRLRRGERFGKMQGMHGWVALGVSERDTCWQRGDLAFRKGWRSRVICRDQVKLQTSLDISKNKRRPARIKKLTSKVASCRWSAQVVVKRSPCWKTTVGIGDCWCRARGMTLHRSALVLMVESLKDRLHAW